MAFERSSLDGAKELDAALAALDKEVATKIGMQADRAAAVALLEKLRQAAPYRPGTNLKYWSTSRGVRSKDYGHLRDNLKVKKARSRNSNYVVYDVTTGDAFWGYFLEFGTVRMAAKPWARPTVEAMKADLVTIQFDILQRGINRIAAGVAKGKMLPNGRRA